MAANIIGRLFRSYRCSVGASSSSSQMVRCYGSRSTRFVTGHFEPMQRMYMPPEDNGRDGNHWLIATKDLDGDRDQMVATYIHLVASVLGSVEEAKKRMYSVSTKYYFAVGLKAPKDLALLFMKHPDVEQVIPDSYVNCATKDYGGEPIIDGQVEPYHPRHHDLYHRGQEEIRQGMIAAAYYAEESKMLARLNKPKRPPTAFFLFMEGFRKEFQEQNPDVKGVGAIAKAGGDRWRLMTDDEKAAFVSAANEMKKADQGKNEADKNKQKQMVRCYGSRSTSQPRFVTGHFEPMQHMYMPPEDKGRDGNHWLIATKKPDGDRDQMVATYIDLVASVLGSVEEAKKRMYSVSTKYYFAVGLKVPKDLALLFIRHPDVERVIEDSYVDCATKDYGGEPIIDGQVVPYDPKHHDLYHRGQEELRQGIIIDAYRAKEDKIIARLNKPKRPPTAFFLFMEGFRKEFKEQNPDVKGVGAIAKAGGERWRLMTDDEKAAFVSAANEMKKADQENMKLIRISSSR